MFRIHRINKLKINCSITILKKGSKLIDNKIKVKLENNKLLSKIVKVGMIAKLCFYI